MKKTCPSREQLFAVVKGDATADQVDFCESHLSDCEDCIRDLEDLSADPDLRGDISLSLRDLPTAGLDETTEATHATALEMGQLQALLGPTDDPSMLGRIGGYEVIGLLGRGGMGAVFKALDRSLNRYVAIKLLQPHIVTSGAARARFAREAQAAAAVVDDHVMPILTVDNWQGMPYLVMPYYRGSSLQQRISEQGPLGVKEVLRIAMQAARALAAAHQQGIIHRDVKPANIFLDAGVERARLMDFGLARAVDDETLTRSGSITGTPQFMSPEQVRGEPLDPRSDLFSLGAVIYAMCTGQAPFRAETSYAVLRRITDHEPRPIREWNPEIPPWLENLVSRLMAKSPASRFQSAREAAELLEDCLAHVQRPLDNPLPETLLTSSSQAEAQTISFVTGMMFSAGAILCAIVATYSLRLSVIEFSLLSLLLVVIIYAARLRLATLFIVSRAALFSLWRNRHMKMIALVILMSLLGLTGAVLQIQQKAADNQQASGGGVIPRVGTGSIPETSQLQSQDSSRETAPEFVSIQSSIVDVEVPLGAELQSLMKDRKPIAEFRAVIDRLIADKKASIVDEMRHPRLQHRGTPLSMGFKDSVIFTLAPRVDGCHVTLKLSPSSIKVGPNSDLSPTSIKVGSPAKPASVALDPKFQAELRYGVAEIIGPFETDDANRVRLIQLTVNQLPEQPEQSGAQIAPRAVAQPPLIPKVPNDSDAVLEAAKQKYAPITEALKDQSLTPAQRSKKLRDLRHQLNPSRQNAKDLTGQPAPPLSVVRWTDGIENRSLADFLGKVVYIEFSRVGYEPGRTATPSLMKKLADKYAGEVVFVSITSPATTDEQVRLQMQRDGWPLLWGIDQSVDDENFLGKTARAFQVTAYPEFVVLDRARRVASSSLAEHRRMTPELAKQAYEEIAELLDRPWPPAESLSGAEMFEINNKLEEYRVEKAIRIAQAATNPAMSAHEQIRTLRLVQGHRVTTGVDTRFPIRVEGKDGFTDDRMVRYGETRLFEFPEPVAEARWQCGDYRTEVIDDIEPFNFLLVEWLEDKLVMTTYRSPKKAEGDSAANTPQSKASITRLEAKLADARERMKLLARIVEGSRSQVLQGKSEESRLIERIVKFDQVREEVAALEYQLANNGLQWSSELGEQIYFDPENGSVTVPDPRKSASSQLSVGMPAPEWELSRWSDNVARRLSDYRGKVVVLDSWAVWCGPCVAAIPEWKKLQSLYQNREVVFLGLHPAGTDDSEIQRLIQEKQWTIPVGIDGAGDNENDTTLHRYGVLGFPTTVIIDGKGTVVFIDNAAPDEANTETTEIEAIARSEGIPWPLDRDATDEELAQRAIKLRFAVVRQHIDRALQHADKSKG
ncbi:MAG: protein kinase [Planctomycetales bacterium]|nr:protein kinase [Planctomycetales bacterium]